MSSGFQNNLTRIDPCHGGSRTSELKMGHVQVRLRLWDTKFLGTLDALVAREPKPAAQQQGDVDAIRSDTATAAARPGSSRLLAHGSDLHAPARRRATS